MYISLKKNLHTQHQVYTLQKYIQTLQRIYCIICIEEVHTGITTLTEAT